MSDTLPIANFPYITWHLDPESLGNFKSYVTIGLWVDAENFQEQVAQYFNDDRPLLEFEKYRRRRVIFEPVGWRVGETPLPGRGLPRSSVERRFLSSRQVCGLDYPFTVLRKIRTLGAARLVSTPSRLGHSGLGSGLPFKVSPNLSSSASPVSQTSTQVFLKSASYAIARRLRAAVLFMIGHVGRFYISASS